MSTDQTRKFEMLVRVDGFGKDNVDLFPATTLGGEAFQALGKAVAELREHRVARQESAGQGRKVKRVARVALVEQIDAIRRNARGIAVANPGFDDPFTAPKSRSDETLVDTARTFIREAERTKEQFARYRAPEGFIDQLRKCLDAFEQASRVHKAGRNMQAEARSGIERAFASAFAALQTLDTVVPNELSTNPGKLAVWEHNRRVDYSRKTRRVTRVVPTPAPAPADAPTAVAPVGPDNTPAPALVRAS